MGRPREFNTEEALEKAMEVFWAQGYEATSLLDLTQAMAISKSSFYDTFGSKHELFVSAIRHYNETVASCRVAATIEQADSVKSGIAAVFHGAADSVLDGGKNCGCFIINCAGEVAPHDANATRQLAVGLKHMEDAFHDAIQKAQADGEIDTQKDARAIGRYLASALNGLILVGKARAERDTLDDIIGLTMACLD
jgi:TetR/AcrR family transcriptional repressor of nem operon